MKQKSRLVHPQPEKKNKSKSESVVHPGQVKEFASSAQAPKELSTGNSKFQAACIDDLRFQVIQRQYMVKQIGQIQGNMHVRREVAHSHFNSSSPVLQRSVLSDELSSIWFSQGRDAFFERLQTVEQSDADLLEFINRNLHGDDWLLARNVMGAPLTQEEIDTIVRERIDHELERFQHIPVDVTGLIPTPQEDTSGGVSVTRHVEVEAAYFINTSIAQSHYATPRTVADFHAISQALQHQHGQISLIEGAGGPRSVGHAVELGKATPDDIRLFIEQALAQGAIQRYAENQHMLLPGQQLIELTEYDLKTVIESWLNNTGVGVDCSGFVQQVAIRAREDVRTSLVGTGTPTAQLPPGISHQERAAASFTGGPPVTLPTDLHPGDAWVVSSGGHIRIVSNVRTVTLPNGSQTIEFETAESSGGSTQAIPGPVRRIWRTSSMAVFDPITRVDSTGTAIGGSFHRIP